MVVVLLVLAVAAVAPPLLRVPGPVTLLHLLADPPSTQGALFASRTVPAARTPRPFPTASRPAPETVPWKGSRVSFTEFLTATSTNSLLVVRDGELIHEWYREGVTATTAQSSWSVAKSVVSLLVGRAIEAGRLREDDRLADILPELATGTDYDRVTVRELLDMTSGVDVSENYNPLWPFTGTARMYLTEDLPGFLAAHRRTAFTPGSRADYRSVDTQLLGAILARVDGRSVGEQLAQDIWDPIGAQDEARWNLDREGGVEKAFCCLNATARDFAKIGQLVLDDGLVGERRIVPSAWLTRISTPVSEPIEGWHYAAQWWRPPGAPHPELAAVGVYGQYIWIDPPTRTVVVKLSDHGTMQDEIDTVEVFRALAAER